LISGEEYRPILFFISWFLVLEVLSIIMAYTTNYYEIIPLMAVLLTFTLLLFIYIVYRARKTILEHL
jgi:uncharacterized membrane protein